jgi:four helix bundle protein
METTTVSKQEALRTRTKQFALRIVRLFRALPKSEEARIIGRQLLRAGTSVAANYRACNRARSKAEFVSKLGTVIEEADEALFWLELLVEAGIVPEARLRELMSEVKQLLAIFCASRHTARRKAVAVVRSPDDPITRSPDASHL